MNTSKNKVATTVKVESSLYDEFKVLGVRYKLSLQGLVERTVYRYVNEDAFREGINNFILPISVATSVVSATSSSLS